ncbi:Transcriptional regulatory protein YpdB [compost metagenome]
MDFLYKENVDLVFLDINMPGLNGMEMLEAMSNRPFVILTTAYKEFALESYKYDVVDYLVKPFDFKRFVFSIDKTVNRIGLKQGNTESPAKDDCIVLKVDGDIVKLRFDSILYTQSYGNYVKFFTREGMFLSQITTTEVENKLDQRFFVRIHKSFIVALKEISKVSGGQLLIFDGTTLPIGNLCRKTLTELLR